MKVIVVGGGPAGMMAAITSAEHQNEVTLIEKKERLGRKLLITGKGRCNITSSLPMEEWINNIPGNGKFLYSCMQEFTNQDIIEFLKKQGLLVKEERGNRIFPVTDRSQDVLTCFEKRLKQVKVRCVKNETVQEILIHKTTNTAKEEKGEKEIEVVGIKTNKQTLKADKVILATGGKSYPLTGSTGDGYRLAKQLGHTITSLKPSLVPLEVEEKEEIKQLQGLSLKNVKVHFIDETRQKQIDEDFGEMIFTHFGVSGPTILSESAHLARVKAIEQKMQEKKIKLQIDLKPALSEEKLEERILRDFNSEKNKQYKNSLDHLLPQKLIPIIIQRSKISPEKKVNEITKQERKNLVKTLKTLTFTIKKFRPIEEAIITSGGISIKEINPKTMESKKVKGLYFAGEIIDVDAYTGGFNLQIAYSTGYVAGKS